MVNISGNRIQFGDDSLAKVLANQNHKLHEDWPGLKTETFASKVFGDQIDFSAKTKNDQGEMSVVDTTVNLRSLMNIYGVKHKHIGDFKKIVKDVVKNMRQGEEKRVDLDEFINKFSEQLLVAYEGDNLEKGQTLQNGEKLAFNPKRFNNIFNKEKDSVKNLFKTIKKHFKEPTSVSQDLILEDSTSITEEYIPEGPIEINQESTTEELSFVPDTPEVIQQATEYADSMGLNLTPIGNLSEDAKLDLGERYDRVDGGNGVKEGYIIDDKSSKDQRLESLITHEDNGTYSVYGAKSGDSGDTVVRIRQGLQDLDQAVTVAKQAQSRVIIDRGKGVGTAAILKDIQTFDKRLDGFSFFAPKGFDIDKEDFSLGQFIVMPDESNKDYPYKIHYRSANGDMKSLNFKFKNPDDVSDKFILISHRGREWACSGFKSDEPNKSDEPIKISMALAFLDNLYGHSPVTGSWKNTEVVSVNRGGNKGVMRLIYSHNSEGNISAIRFNPKPPVEGEAGLMQYEEETFSLPQPTKDRSEAIALLTEDIKANFSSDGLKVNEDTVIMNYATKNTMKEGSFDVLTTVNSKYLDLNEDGSFKCGNLSFDSIDEFMKSEDINLGPMINRSPVDYKGKIVSIPLHEQVAAAVTGSDHGLNEYAIVSTQDPNVYSLSWSYEDTGGNIVEKEVEMRTFEDHQYIELQTELGTTHTINSFEDLEYAINLFSSTHSNQERGGNSYFYIQNAEGKLQSAYINNNGELRVRQPDNSYKSVASDIENFEAIKDKIGTEALLPGCTVKCPPSYAVSSTFIHTKKEATVDESGNKKFDTFASTYTTDISAANFKNISDLKASTENTQLKYQLRELKGKPLSKTKSQPVVVEEAKPKDVKKTISDTPGSKSPVKDEFSEDISPKTIKDHALDMGVIKTEDELQADLIKDEPLLQNKEPAEANSSKATVEEPKQDELSKAMWDPKFPEVIDGTKQHLLNTFKNASNENREAVIALVEGSGKFEFKPDKFEQLMKDVTKYISICNKNDSVAPLKPFHMDILLEYCDRSLPSDSLGALVIFLGDCIESEEQWQDYMPVVEMLTQGNLFKDGNDLIMLMKEKFRLINGDSSFAKGTLFYQTKDMRSRNATKSLGKIHAILANLDKPLSVHPQKILIEKLLKDENIEGSHLRNLLDANSYVHKDKVAKIARSIEMDEESEDLLLLWLSQYTESEKNAPFALAIANIWKSFTLMPEDKCKEILINREYYALNDTQMEAYLKELNAYIEKYFKPKEVKQEVIEDDSDSSDYESIEEHEDEPKNVSEFLETKEQKENIKDARKDRPKPGGRRPPTRKPNQ